jgi:hypothetical protein
MLAHRSFPTHDFHIWFVHSTERYQKEVVDRTGNKNMKNEKKRAKMIFSSIQVCGAFLFGDTHKMKMKKKKSWG